MAHELRLAAATLLSRQGGVYVLTTSTDTLGVVRYSVTKQPYSSTNLAGTSPSAICAGDWDG